MTGRKRSRWKTSVCGKKIPQQNSNTHTHKVIVKGENTVLVCDYPFRLHTAYCQYWKKWEKGRFHKKNLERAKNFKWGC